MLDPGTILKINGTVLAGILILFTITSFDEEISLEVKLNEINRDLQFWEQKLNIHVLENERLTKEDQRLFEETNFKKNQLDLLNKSLSEINSQVKDKQDEIQIVQEHIDSWGRTKYSSGFSLVGDLEQDLVKKETELAELIPKQANLDQGVKLIEKEFSVKNQEYFKTHNELKSNESDMKLVKFRVDTIKLEKDVIEKEIERLGLEERLRELKTPYSQLYYLGIGFAISGLFAVFASFIEDMKRKNLYKGLMIGSYAGLGTGFILFIVIFLTLGLT